MICKYCGKPVVLVPSAEERARKDVTGKSADYYRKLFPTHASCMLQYRDTLSALGLPFIVNFIAAYKTAAEWSSHAPERSKVEFIDGTRATWSAEAAAEASAICHQFCRANAAKLAEADARGVGPDSLGHDLWLTAAGHGAGFWDRKDLEAGDLGKHLTEACKVKPYADREIYVYRNKIHYV